MINNNPLLIAWSYALVIISYVFLLTKIFNLRSKPFKYEAAKSLVLLAVLSTIIWGFWGLINSVFPNEALKKLEWVFDYLRYLFWCCFFIHIIRSNNKNNRYVYGAILSLLSVAFLLFIFLPRNNSIFFLNVDKSVIVDATGRLIRLAFSIFALVLVEQLFSNSEGDVRWKIKPLCIGMASVFIFDLYIFSEDILFGKIDFDASAVRGVMYALIVPLLFVTLASRSRNNLKFKISKNSAFHSVVLTLSGVYLILIASVGYYVKYFGGDWGRALQLVIVYASLLLFSIVLFSNILRSKIKVYIEKNFFQYIFDYREQWLNFTNVLVEKDSILEMEQQIIKGFSNMLESPSGSLWIKKIKDGAFNQVAQFNQGHTQLSEDSKSSFCVFMAKTGWVVDIDQYRVFPEVYGGMKLPDWVQNLPETWLIFPLLVGEEMIGFCVLDKAEHPVAVNWEVSDLLKTAGRQAAGFLTQMQATEALLETQKFASFNRMSAFVVHDLKNIVTQLSLMMNNSQRLLSNPDFQKDMLLTVDNSLLRMRQLMLQLREGTPFLVASSGVNLEAVIARLQATATKSGRKIVFKLRATALARGQEDRVERILGHLIQNALDATEDAGDVRITLDKVDEQAQIVLFDTGQGMTQEFLSERLFKPFQTTKPHGMGIGAYESYIYIRELGGSICVESTKDIGTTLTIRLPLFESSVAEINPLLEAT